MSRTASAHLTTMLAKKGADVQTRARCVWIARRDGTVLGFTDHDRDLTIDLTDISDVPVTFRADVGIMASDITLTTGLDADSVEISGPLGSVVTRADVLGRRYNRAQIRMFDVDWNQTWPDVLALMAGHIADVKIQGGRFVFEARSVADLYNQPIGRLITPYCTADFGDSQCGVALTNIAATVTAVTDDFRFTLGGLAGTYANDYFNLGTVVFLSGDLAGQEQVEVFDYVGATGAVTLFAPLAASPSVGDTLYIRRGCSKIRKSDDATLPTCLTYDNVINFRGFPDVPGSDQYLKYPVPGSSGV